MSLRPAQQRRFRHVLLAGGVLAYPTEGVYGLGCRPTDPLAVARILAIKRRPPHKGLILVASEPEQIESFLAPVDAAIAAPALNTWPGPTTWLWPARHWVPYWLCGDHPTLAVRVSSHPVVRALCDALGGPLVSTSANRSGQPPARTRHVLRRRFGCDVDAIVPGECGGLGGPSEIRDLLTGELIRTRRP